MIPYLRDNTISFTEVYLRDAVSCVVTEERNGEYTLELQYPVGGQGWESISPNKTIVARVNDEETLDYFKIYSIEKTSDGLMTVRANHWSYDLSGHYRTGQTYRGTAEAVLQSLLNGTDFTGRSDITGTGQITVAEPSSIRAIINGGEGSIVDIYGGELEFFRSRVTLHSARGQDRGVVLEYGENITWIRYEKNSEDKCRGVTGYAAYTEATSGGPTGQDLTKYATYSAFFSPAVTDTTKMFLVDLTDKMPSSDQTMVESLLPGAVANFINAHPELARERETQSVEFVPRWYQGEYAGEQVQLCDTVTISYAPFGIETKAKVIKTTYDTLQERFTKIEVGDPTNNIVDTIVQGDKAAGLVKAEVSLYPARWRAEIEAAIRNITTNGLTVQSGTDRVEVQPEGVLFADGVATPTLRVFRRTRDAAGTSTMTLENGLYIAYVTHRNNTTASESGEYIIQVNSNSSIRTIAAAGNQTLSISGNTLTWTTDNTYRQLRLIYIN